MDKKNIIWVKTNKELPPKKLKTHLCKIQIGKKEFIDKLEFCETTKKKEFDWDLFEYQIKFKKPKVIAWAKLS